MKFRASHCPLPPDSIGYKIIQKYRRKHELTYQSQRTKSATTRRRSLLAEHRKDYFGERLKVTNEADYHKYQLDLASIKHLHLTPYKTVNPPHPHHSRPTLKMQQLLLHNSGMFLAKPRPIVWDLFLLLANANGYKGRQNNKGTRTSLQPAKKDQNPPTNFEMNTHMGDSCSI